MSSQIIEDLLATGKRIVEAREKEKEEKKHAEEELIANQWKENLLHAQNTFSQYLADIHKVPSTDAVSFSRLYMGLRTDVDVSLPNKWTDAKYLLSIPKIAPILVDFSTKKPDLLFVVPKICRGDEGDLFYSFSNRNNAIGLIDRLEVLDLEIAMYHAAQLFEKMGKCQDEYEAAKNRMPDQEPVGEPVGEVDREMKTVGDLVDMIVSRVLEKLQEK